MDFQDFKDAYQKIPIGHYPNNVPEDPVVSVCVQTYQHVDYIEDCLEGILMQETDFTYEILLGEDASTDGTREICIKYAQKYPDKIRLFLHERENNITIAEQPTGRFNFLYNLYSAKGKYIALCEGDDYWTDPLKLQKQVGFLEGNTSYSGVYTNFSRCNENGKVLLNRVLTDGQPSFFDKNTVFKRHSSRTLTVMYRTIESVINALSNFNDHVNADRVLSVLMAQEGKIKYMDFVTGVYRRGSGYHSSMHPEEKRQNRLKLYLTFKSFFSEAEILETIDCQLNKLYLDEIS